MRVIPFRCSACHRRNDDRNEWSILQWREHLSARLRHFQDCSPTGKERTRHQSQSGGIYTRASCREVYSVQQAQGKGEKKQPMPTLIADFDAMFGVTQETERSPRRKASNNEEHLLQCKCVQWFRHEYPEYRSLLFAIPNAGKRSPAVARWLKDEGMVDGVSDLILLVPRGGYGALCLETKIPSANSKLSPAQKAWLSAAEKAGNRAEVYRTQEEFQRIVTNYLTY